MKNMVYCSWAQEGLDPGALLQTAGTSTPEFFDYIYFSDQEKHKQDDSAV